MNKRLQVFAETLFPLEYITLNSATYCRNGGKDAALLTSFYECYFMHNLFMLKCISYLNVLFMKLNLNVVVTS